MVAKVTESDLYNQMSLLTCVPFAAQSRSVLDGLKGGEFVGVTCRDLSKAFDCVTPEVLVKKP